MINAKLNLAHVCRLPGSARHEHTPKVAAEPHAGAQAASPGIAVQFQHTRAHWVSSSASQRIYATSIGLPSGAVPWPSVTVQASSCAAYLLQNDALLLRVYLPGDC